MGRKNVITKLSDVLWMVLVVAPEKASNLLIVH